MPTVDDLIVSLRIDETSNLGNLQKQLTALVGKKGEKAVGIGLDADTKRDLQIIKDRIVKFTPSVLMDSNLKEGALALAVDLKKDTGLRNQLIQKYGINIVKYESLLEELFNISLGISELNSDQQKIFIAEMDTFRKLADTTKGELKTTIVKLTKMMLEKGFQKRLVNAFRESGVGMLSKTRVFQLTEESMGGKMDETIKRFKEDDPTGFAALVKIFEDNSDSLEATSEAYKLQTGKTLDLTQLSQKKIYDTVELHKIIAAQASAALTKAQWMQDVFYKAARQLFTKTGFAVKGAAELDSVIARVSQKTLKDLGIEHVVGDQIEDSMVNILGEFKTVAGKDAIDSEVIKRLNTQNYKKLFFFAEEFSDDALERIRYYNELEENKNKQIGAYKLTPRAVEILLGTAAKLDDLEAQAVKANTKEEKKDEELDEATKEEMRIMEQMFAGLDDIEKEGKEEGPTISETEKMRLAEERHKNIAEKIDETKKVVDNIDDKVKPEDLNEVTQEKDPTENGE